MVTEASGVSRHIPVTPLPFSTIASPAGELLTSRACRLMGWSVREATGAAIAELAILDGLDGTGQEVADTLMAGGQSSQQAFSEPGVELSRGAFVLARQGSVRGTVYVRGI